MIDAGWSRARRLVGTASLAGCLALAGAAEGAPGRRAVAPGRVVFPVNGGIPVAGGAGVGATDVVGLAGGGAVLVGGGFPGGRGFYAAAVTSTGGLDPSFGSRGVARVDVGRRVIPVGVLSQPDGKLVVVGSTGSGERRLVLVRLNADGGLDRSFGSGGVAATPVGTACQSCTPAGLTPDGEFILTGEAPGSGASPTWIVTRLTASGAVDQAFGHEGTITIPETGASGYDVAVLGDGAIIALGVAAVKAAKTSVAIVTRLRPDGLPEFDFNGGTPADLPSGSGASAMLVYPDGSVLIGGTSALFRYSSVGAPDVGFGTRGVARIGSLPSGLELLAAAGGASVVVGRSAGSADTLRAIGVAADGRIGQDVVYRPLFGGGTAGGVSRLAQDSFIAGRVAVLADGSYLAVGGVSVRQAPGRGAGRSIFDFAAAALTPSFNPAVGFGGRARRLTVRLGIPSQSAGSARARRSIRVRLDASAPGLARVTIRGGGRVVARSVVAVLGSGPRSLRVGLTAAGSAVLAAGVRVTASAGGRDVLGATAQASATGRLR